MARSASSLALASLLFVSACGASEPREADIYHDPALRPGVVTSEGPEQQLLAQLDGVALTGTVEVSGQSFRVDAPYEAASGRRCRGIHGAAGSRLACTEQDGWVFVPAVLPTVSAEPAP